jgi:CheY-like chemotaxis protein
MKGAKVLVVDDNPDIIESIQEIFEAKFPQAEVKGALTGIAALAMMEEQTPDIVLLDIMMPDVDGWAVASRMHENPKLRNVPVLYVTAKIDELSRRMGEISSEDYVMKPFKAEDLLNRVRRILVKYKYMKNHPILLIYGTLDAATLVIPAIALASTTYTGLAAFAAAAAGFLLTLYGLDIGLMMAAPVIREEKKILHETNMTYWRAHLGPLVKEVPTLWLIAFLPPLMITPTLASLPLYIIPPAIWGIYWVGYKPIRLQWK